MTSKRLLLGLSLLVSLLLVAAPAGATDPGAAGGVAAPVPDELAVPAPPAEAAQTETTPTTPGGEEQPDGEPTETETAPGGGGPVDEVPEDGVAGESTGGLPRTGLEVAALAMIGLGLLMAGLALRPTSSWPPPRDRLSRSIPRR